jgi:hypothetical protein
MLAGVEILLERMKTNPEEFVEGGYSKWSRVLDSSWAILAEDEREALQAGMIEAKREHFNGEVMRVLSGGEETTDTEDERLYKQKRLMQGNAITSQNMMNQATKILSDEFDKAYAKTKTPRTPNR